MGENHPLVLLFNSTLTRCYGSSTNLTAAVVCLGIMWEMSLPFMSFMKLLDVTGRLN